MILPDVKRPSQSKRDLTGFGGYNATGSAQETEFAAMENLSSREYPALATRPKRGTVSQLTAPQALLQRDALLYIDQRTIYYNGAAVAGPVLTDGVKQVVSIGAYVVIFPDKLYLNTAKLTDWGYLEASAQSTGAVTYSLCMRDGTAYTGYTTAAAAPENPANGALWVDTSGSVSVLKQYSTTTSMWVQIATTYVRIGAAGIGTGLSKGDGVTLAGCAGSAQVEALNQTCVLQDVAADYLVVTGVLDQAVTQQTGTVTAARTVPEMDYVCEAQNRLWGCKYGIVDGKPVNELYCCKLGDFKNWRVYAGISTDSWAASLGSDGEFTGAFNYLGYPTFFKENVIHRVAVSSSGAHQITTTNGRGVQKGCWRSLCTVGETLYYKARGCVCAYTGAMPGSASDALGETPYFDARAGALGSRYYLSMADASGAWNLFVYDAARRLWHREDATKALAFAACDGDLYYIDETTKQLRCTLGSAGTKESDFGWSCEAGLTGMDAWQQKYVSRVSIRGKLDEGAVMRVYLQHDADGAWLPKGELRGNGLRSFLLPITPRRCDHVRLRLEGTGGAVIFSIHETYEKGSDVL